MAWAYHNSGLSGFHIPDIPGDNWTPDEITYPSIGGYNPSVVVDSMTGEDYDPGINDTQQLVMASTSGGGLLRTGVAINTATAYKQLHARIIGEVLINATYNGPGHAGIFGLASDPDLAEGGGGKGFALVLDTLFFNNRIRLYQINDGLSGGNGGAYPSSYTLLAETAINHFTDGQAVLLELEWESDPINLRGTRLQAWYAQGGGDLTKLWDIVYAGADAYVPDDVSDIAGAGVCLSMLTNQMIAYYDNVAIAL